MSNFFRKGIFFLFMLSCASLWAAAQSNPSLKAIKAIDETTLDQLRSAGEALTQEQFRDLTKSAYDGQEITVTAVVLSDPLNSGLATNVERIHVFVRDTMATQDPAGMLGYGIQIVDSNFEANGWLDVAPGAVVKITATVTYFSAVLQLAPAAVTIVASHYSQVGLPDAIMEPVEIPLAELNQPVAYTDPASSIAHQVTVNFDTYALTNQDYVRLTEATVLAREADATGRPNWVLTNADETAHVQVYDVSLRYRNDRIGHQNYTTRGFHVREEAFVPPSVGARVNLQGFAVPEPEFSDPYGLATPDNIMLKIVPFEDTDLEVIATETQDAATDYAVTASNQSVLVRVLGNDGVAATLTAVAAAEHGTTEIEGNAVRYHPDAGFAGIDAFRYTATAGGTTLEATAYVSVGTSAAARIILDEAFVDWNDVPTLHAEPAELTADVPEIVQLAVANDEGHLFLRLSLSEVLGLQENNTLSLHIDTDGDSTTGTAFPGMGADFRYTFGRREGQFRGTSIGHAPLELVSMPTYASDVFEVRLDLNAEVAGDRIFSADTLRLMLTSDEGERLPSLPAPLAYIVADAAALAPLEVVPLDPFPGALRVVSFNAEFDGIFGGVEKEAFGRLARAVTPDVIGFQEIYNHTGTEAAALVGEVLPLGDGETWYGAKAGVDLVVVSRYPVLHAYDIGDNGAFLVDASAALGEDLLIINAHPPCCQNDAGRNREADEIMAFLRDVKTGMYAEIAQDTPLLILGDLNMVGTDTSLRTYLTGDITDNGNYGPDFAPDWDGTPLTDARPRLAGTPAAFTWYNAGSSFAPGRLDFLIYADSKLRLKRTYGIYTPDFAPDILVQYGLQADDALTASDHLMLVGDFALRSSTNQPPIATADAFQLSEDEGALLDLLANDTDMDGDPLTTAIVAAPAHGQLAAAANGTWRYTPAPDFHGTDAFTYAASDGTASDTAQVYLTIVAVNDPPVFSIPVFTTPADGATLYVGEHTDPVPGDETLLIAWHAAVDVDTESLSYVWELASDEAFGTILLSIEAGTDNQVTPTHGTVSDALIAHGIPLHQETQLWHRVRADDGAVEGTSEGIALPTVRGNVVALESESVPLVFALTTPYPNPFTHTTRIAFSLPQRDHVRLSIHDVLGREVAVLAEAAYVPGLHEVTWDGSALPSGTYFVRLATSVRLFSKTIVRIR